MPSRGIKVIRRWGGRGYVGQVFWYVFHAGMNLSKKRCNNMNTVSGNILFHARTFQRRETAIRRETMVGCTRLKIVGCLPPLLRQLLAKAGRCLL